MKKLSAALLALLLILTGCQKQQRQADIRLPLLFLAARQYQQKRQQRSRQFFHLFLLFVRKLMFSPSS